ncbi:thioredoxin family protein [Rhodobacter sp. NTK016B]|uniref:thioredoxin family protein n=1 Tax=Rhodobacter sp. NTK016B TaxID=2759676 RepID=UPI00257121D5|nr:thioredoxin family protein [Rhodobacter sp. NTK016B]
MPSPETPRFPMPTPRALPKGFLALLLAFLVTLSAPQSARAQDLRLLMIEQVGCYICAAFNRDVAPAYEASAEGARAPLIRADLRGPLPEGVTLDTRPFVTPTFVLLGPDGAEISRLTGFPGEDFFWPYINEMLDAAEASPAG